MIELNFNLETVEYVEFGVGRDHNNSQMFYLVSVGKKAQDALHDMVANTWGDMAESVKGNPTQMELKERYVAAKVSQFISTPDVKRMQDTLEGGPRPYSPSEKYSGTEYLYVPLDDQMVASQQELHSATNLPIDNELLAESDSVFCYFARMNDNAGRRITAVRRAAGFKGVLKSNLLSWITGDGLDLMDQKVFKLDEDFDILIDSEHVHIWRPASFEAVGKLKEDILAAVGGNIEAIRQGINFVEFDNIQKYARTHIMAARYLASIRVQASEGPISKDALLNLCKDTQIDVEE